MKIKSSNIVLLLTVAASFFIAVYFYPLLPDKIISHWNVYGKADDYMPKLFGLLWFPVLLVILDLLFVIIPKIDPLKKNIESFRKYFDDFILLFNIFFFYLFALTIFANLGFAFNMVWALMPAFAIFFYYIGVMMGNAKRNYFIGIRTPWTLASDKVWEKTHKLGGLLFKVGGILFLLSMIDPFVGFVVIISYLLAITVFLVVYSYIEFKKEERHKHT
ncbi:MAG: SdpI family protein [Candidatus Paceibacterota bacterium]